MGAETSISPITNAQSSTTPSIDTHSDQVGIIRRSVLDLQDATVRLPAPELVLELLRDRSAIAGRNLQFSASSELPSRIAGRVDRFFKEPLTPNNVLITLGVREGLKHLIATHEKLSSGIIVMPPCYPGYLKFLEEHGVPKTKINLEMKGNRYSMDLDKIRSRFSLSRNDRSRKSPGGIIVTAPNTPTNAFPLQAQLRELNSMCELLAKTLIVDNTFDTFDLTEPWSPTPLSLSSTVVVGNISEAYSLAQHGIQIGYLVASEETIATIRYAQRFFPRDSVEPSRLARACAFVSLFESESYLERRNMVLRERHAFAEDRLSELKCVQEISGQAGTTKWVTFPSIEIAEKAVDTLASNGIIVKPGKDYGDKAAIRISLVCQTQDCDFRAAIGKVISVMRTI